MDYFDGGKRTFICHLYNPGATIMEFNRNKRLDGSLISDSNIKIGDSSMNVNWASPLKGTGG